MASDPVLPQTQSVAPRRILVAYLLWLIMGIFGAHRFYLRDTRWGVVYLLTLGLAGIGLLVDLFRLPSYVRRFNRTLAEGRKPAPLFTPEQRRSLLIGFGLILAAATLIALIWLGTYLPGFLGEVFSMFAGLMWTPLVLDFTIFLFGVVLILWLNMFIRAREGDEFVYLEQVEGPDVPADLPEEARSAVFREKPVPQGLEPSLASIEGALALDDLGEAADLLFELPPDQVDEPEVLTLRIQLARKQGHEEKAVELIEALRLKSPHHSLCSKEVPPDC
ncbi:MAG: TM2 domain-containing protein [Roseibacillus sp.]